MERARRSLSIGPGERAGSCAATSTCWGSSTGDRWCRPYFAEGIDHLRRRGRAFDLIFVGPPYGKGLADSALRLLGDGRLLAPEAIVTSEVRKGTEIALSYGKLQCVDRRTYGDNTLFFHRLEEGIGWQGVGDGVEC